jgi:uncharacterized protein YgfB (UPF0149 family)
MQPDYSLICRLLADSAVELTPAVIHGALTGFVSSGAPLQVEVFHDLFELSLPEVVDKLIERLGQETCAQLQAPDFSFQLLLPAEDDPLADRLDALSTWCDWFTVGFAAGYMRPQTDLSAEMMEVLNDFSQLANIDPETARDDEQDELSYVELVEYVRMASISLYQQLNPVDTQADATTEESREESLFADPDDRFLH